MTEFGELRSATQARPLNWPEICRRFAVGVEGEEGRRLFKYLSDIAAQTGTMDEFAREWFGARFDVCVLQASSDKIEHEESSRLRKQANAWIDDHLVVKITFGGVGQSNMFGATTFYPWTDAETARNVRQMVDAHSASGRVMLLDPPTRLTITSNIPEPAGSTDAEYRYGIGDNYVFPGNEATDRLQTIATQMRLSRQAFSDSNTIRDHIDESTRAWVRVQAEADTRRFMATKQFEQPFDFVQTCHEWLIAGTMPNYSHVFELDDLLVWFDRYMGAPDLECEIESYLAVLFEGVDRSYELTVKPTVVEYGVSRSYDVELRFEQ